MCYKPMEICSISPSLREMQIKTTISAQNRMAMIKISTDKCWRGCGENRWNPPNYWWECNVN